jgi:hypothetical protein
MKLLLGILSVSLLTPSAMAQQRPNLDALIDRWAADNRVHVTDQPPLSGPGGMLV